MPATLTVDSVVRQSNIPEMAKVNLRYKTSSLSWILIRMMETVRRLKKNLCELNESSSFGS